MSILLIILVAILGIYVYTASSNDESLLQNTALQQVILKNSNWYTLSSEDLNGYLNSTYTSTVQLIINSLEESYPVIFKTCNNKFGTENFVVASAFTSNNKIYVYCYNREAKNYSKSTCLLENLLEDSIAVYIYNETEGM